MKTVVLLEDSWEAIDIIDFCKNKQIECIILSEKELYERSDFLQCVYFCNTDIVRFHIYNCLLSKEYKSIDVKNLLDMVYPDTYESVYYEYFKRKITKTNMKCLENVLLQDKSVFIKPVGNNKRFDGRVVSSVSDIEELMSDCDISSVENGNCALSTHVGFEDKIPLHTFDNINEVYVCNVIELVSESRLLIGNGRLYGYGHICKTKNFSFLSQMDINKIIEISGDNFRCIDVGLTKNGEWVIVEINPPFSLDDYEIPLDMYMNFCIGACKWINEKIKF